MWPFKRSWTRQQVDGYVSWQVGMSGRARVERVRCWPLTSVWKPWRWYLPTPGGGVLQGEAATHPEAMLQLEHFAGAWGAGPAAGVVKDAEEETDG